MKRYIFIILLMMFCVCSISSCANNKVDNTADFVTTNPQAYVEETVQSQSPTSTITPQYSKVLEDYEDYPGILDFGAYSGLEGTVTTSDSVTGFLYKNTNQDIIDDYLDELENTGFYTDPDQALVSAMLGEIDRNRIWITNGQYSLYLSIYDNGLFIAIQNIDNTSTPSYDNAQTTTTTGEKNALQSAKDYLNVMAFSYSGLIEQLEYEGYTNSEATYAADNCGADWYEQAALSAKEYLEVMSFSKEGLIEQLEYEGFTYSQAVYGVEQNGY